MMTATGWVLRTWLKTTLLLALVIGVVWLITGTGGWFWGTVLVSALVEWWLVRQLAREWSWQARGSWWWAR